MLGYYYLRLANNWLYDKICIRHSAFMCFVNLCRTQPRFGPTDTRIDLHVQTPYSPSNISVFTLRLFLYPIAQSTCGYWCFLRLLLSLLPGGSPKARVNSPNVETPVPLTTAGESVSTYIPLLGGLLQTPSLEDLYSDASSCHVFQIRGLPRHPL